MDVIINGAHPSIQDRLQRLYEQMSELFRATNDASDRSIRVFLFQIASELHALPRGLPREKIDGLPEVQITSQQRQTDLSCTICLEDFKNEEMVKELPCKVSEKNAIRRICHAVGCARQHYFASDF